MLTRDVDDDVGLAARAAEGDPAAFELLVRRHTDAAWRLARSLLRDDFAAEEAVQDTFVKAHGRLATFRGDAAFRTWLLAICHRTCLDRLRLRRAETVPLEAAPRLTARTPDTDDRLVIERALAALPEPERQAFTLVHVLGYSREEAAAVTGEPASTVRSRVSRACARLAEALADVGPCAGPPDGPTPHRPRGAPR